MALLPRSGAVKPPIGGSLRSPIGDRECEKGASPETAKEIPMSRTSMRSLVALPLVAAALMLATVTQAATVDKCSAGKRKCIAKKVQGLLGCHAKAEASGSLVDPSCVNKVQDKFDGGAVPANGCFEKLETKYPGCLTVDDQATLETAIDVFVQEAVSAVDPGYPAPAFNKCAAAKKKCIAKKTAALLNCHAKAAATGFLDPACVLKAQRKFDGSLLASPDPSKGCIEKLEAKYPANGATPCFTYDDTSALETMVDAFVHTSACRLDPFDPACECPTTAAFTPDADDAGTRLDVGSAGLVYGSRLMSDATITFSVSNCSGPRIPCGSCTLSGPGDAPDRQYRRCTGDTSVSCATDADCSGAGGTCEYFLGGPLPISAGGASTCLVTQVAGPITGTLNVESGAAATSTSVVTRWYSAPTLAQPCPQCVGDSIANDGARVGTCSGGARNGLGCDANGTSPNPFFGAVALDCPPLPGGLIAAAAMTFDSTTAQATEVLNAARPQCRAAGWTSQKCFCDTCNSGALANALPCESNADCPDPAGPIGPICGGRRCVSGANAGAACTVNSECPGSGCAVPGTPTSSNSCDDGICTATADGDGVCAAGPTESFCGPTATFAGCITDADCNAYPGNTCSIMKNRPCFPDNGNIGAQVVASGVASPTHPTWASLYCVAPTFSAVANIVYALPGLARLTRRGTIETSIEAPHHVFATSTLQTGNLGNLAGADAICQTRANAAGLNGTFKAWLSSATTSAASRLTHGLSSYVLVNGTLVANGWLDLTDGTLDAPIDRDEFDNPAGGSVWTNSTIDGAIDAAECLQWTSTTVGHKGQTGVAGSATSTWTDDVPFEDCFQSHRLYCVEQ
jgi:hypothetical protein